MNSRQLGLPRWAGWIVISFHRAAGARSQRLSWNRAWGRGSPGARGEGGQRARGGAKPGGAGREPGRGGDGGRSQLCSGDPHCGWEGTGSMAGAGRRGAGVGSWRGGGRARGGGGGPPGGGGGPGGWGGGGGGGGGGAARGGGGGGLPRCPLGGRRGGWERPLRALLGPQGSASSGRGGGVRTTGQGTGTAWSREPRSPPSVGTTCRSQKGLAFGLKALTAPPLC